MALHCISLGTFNPGALANAAGARLRKALPAACSLEQSSCSSLEAEDVKLALRETLKGINRGIFGVQTPKKVEIEGLVSKLESMNPCPNPTENLDMLNGRWQLLYSTISILGSKRTKLGLRDFISLGDFIQSINVEEMTAVNSIGFNVAALTMLRGYLIITASYTISSPTRVDIKFDSSSIVPEQLFNLFQKNYDLLLSIFNPAGWLEITYLDQSWRVGRDDKNNIFVVEKLAA